MPNKFIPLKEYFFKSGKFIPITKENLPNKIIEGKILKVLNAHCDCVIMN
tara:strand:- start:558 stop:707 length:150 start_codon:yes stop_codon:yes gene_type:complete